jgi:hypothetical protein
MTDALFQGLNALRSQFDLSYRERKALETAISMELAAERVKTWHGQSNRVHRVLAALQESRHVRGVKRFPFDAVEDAANKLFRQVESAAA